VGQGQGRTVNPRVASRPSSVNLELWLFPAMGLVVAADIGGGIALLVRLEDDESGRPARRKMPA
jgi:hypothetical protein